MRDIIVIGASAGGIEPLSKLVRGLAPDIRAAVFVVLHIPSDANSALPQVLTRLGTLPAVHPNDGEPLKRGRIYVAPPDRHLVVQRGTVRVSVGPKENRRRPSIDLLFRTAARSYGPRVIGVLLSGLSDDGGAGLATVSARGGVTIVQDPADARFSQMSRNAMELIKVDHCVAADAMGPLLMSLVLGGAAPVATEGQIAAEQEQAIMDNKVEPSRFGCPDCGGVLWQINDETLRFQCRIGHAYSIAGLENAQSDKIEDSLWATIRGMSERADLLRWLATRAREREDLLSASKLTEAAAATEHEMRVLQQTLRGSREQND